ncbi:MAG: 3-hydroxyacyl-ACP dehydratase FabZ [Firmicutes bacterium]|nr:3-hydroxyacyl-ACP dehydratase FabZ [Bacillota bacterium]
MLDINQIMERLPHRYPFLLVDRVLELERGKRAVVVKNVTINEPFFQGHYPNLPVMPGVLIIEAMAQAGGLAAAVDSDADMVPLFAAIDKARFRRVVRPGDQLIITIEVLRARGSYIKVKATAEVDKELAAEGELTFVLTEKGVSNSNGTSKSDDNRK